MFLLIMFYFLNFFVAIPYGLAVRILGFHPGGPGSTPGMGIIFCTTKRRAQNWLKNPRVKCSNGIEFILSIEFIQRNFHVYMFKCTPSNQSRHAFFYSAKQGRPHSFEKSLNFKKSLKSPWILSCVLEKSLNFPQNRICKLNILHCACRDIVEAL